MTRTFRVQNVKCGGCAATLKKKLEPLFGAVCVNLDVMPREITLDIDETQTEALRDALRSIGYPLSNDTLGFVETAETKVKSFVSCAAGKLSKEE